MDTQDKKSSDNTQLLHEILTAINNIKGWGSVEIYIQDHKVVQITERNIKKTKHLTNGREMTS